MAKAKTYKGVTYWPSYQAARDYAVLIMHWEPGDIKLRSYERGWAIQKQDSGPYWNANNLAWE